MPFGEEHLPDLYRLLIENLHDTAVFLIDKEGRMSSWNPGVEEVLGYRKDEFVDRHAALVFVPEDVRAGVPLREMAQAAREGRAADQRWHVRKDGRRIFVDGVLVALRTGDGLVGYAKFMRDITARKRAVDEQKLLADAGAMLASSLDYNTTLRNIARLAVEAVADYCIFHLITSERKIGRVAWAHRNPACNRLMDHVMKRLPPPDLRQHPLAERLLSGEPVFVPEVTSEWMEQNLSGLAGFRIGKRFGLRSLMTVPLPGRSAILGALTFCLDSSSGRHFDSQELELAMELGRRAGMAMDNARLYQATTESEARLREQERTLRLATEAAGVGIWSLEIPSGKATVSEQCRRLLGLAPSGPEVTYRDFMGSVHPEDRERLEAAVKQSFEHSSEYEVEFRLICPDGTVRRLVAKGHVEIEEGKRGSRFHGVLLDVTEQRRREQADAEAHRLEGIGLLAGGIAHEFNNLLTGIIGNATLIAEELPPGSPMAVMAADVLHSAGRAAELTRQLLAYSGKGRFMPRPLDLSEEVGKVASLLEASVPHKVRLLLNLQTGLPRIEADAAQIQQAVVDLVLNAGEAIGEREGTVEVSSGVAALDEEAIRQRFADAGITPGTYLALEVRDDGSGMDERVQNRIFEPFFSTKFAGRGLGLPAVQGVVRGHRGAIEVKSSPGKGTTVRLFLPALQEAETQETADLSPTATTATGLILVADDEDVVRRVAKSALERRGYGVVLAADGREAVEVFRSMPARITAVLLDMTMPVMNGAEAMAQIRALRPDVPVIATSGYNEAEALRRFGAGVTAYLQKPFTAAQLAEIVRGVAG